MKEIGSHVLWSFNHYVLIHMIVLMQLIINFLSAAYDKKNTEVFLARELQGRPMILRQLSREAD